MKKIKGKQLNQRDEQMSVYSVASFIFTNIFDVNSETFFLHSRMGDTQMCSHSQIRNQCINGN